jgi:predicted nucleic acid-binding Zn ribbon protein
MTEAEQEYACGTCGSKLRRIYTAPPVKFNGTGFYSTGG